MEIKASIVVMSHLSDAQELIGFNDNADISKRINNHINFAKYIILKTNGDLTKEIDPDKIYEEFCNRNK
jgi:hypothetical protein